VAEREELGSNILREKSVNYGAAAQTMDPIVNPLARMWDRRPTGWTKRTESQRSDVVFLRVCTKWRVRSTMYAEQSTRSSVLMKLPAAHEPAGDIGGLQRSTLGR
jgi:hypothetical protein